MTRVVPVSTVVDGLKRLESGLITTGSVLDLLADVQVDAGSVKRYAAWVDDRHARHLVHRDDLFEVLLLCWRPGNRTPVHTHNGQLGWATIVRGGLAVTDYEWHGCNKPENQNVVGIDCVAGATQIDLRAKPTVRATVGGPVATVSKTQTIHQIECPPDVGELTASIHIYSRPIDSCVMFDLVHQRCARRDLKYDSVGGVQASPQPV
ncbi:MAG TPA: cysteine dioxygenase family protein [Planctomycetota bacterium]|nr:cysteine dioxygenase family protein [Planctomycetota bacterium]